MKTDASPLLAAGIHHVTSHRLKEITVDAFPGDARRAELFGKFIVWRDALRLMGLSGKAWFDGSFLTAKDCPGDIDLILWSPIMSRPLSQAEHAALAALFDKPLARATYDLDLYIELPASDDARVHREAYWRGLFGFCHDGRTAKGIAEVVI